MSLLIPNRKTGSTASSGMFSAAISKSSSRFRLGLLIPAPEDSILFKGPKASDFFRANDPPRDDVGVAADDVEACGEAVVGFSLGVIIFSGSLAADCGTTAGTGVFDFDDRPLLAFFWGRPRF